MGGCVVSQIHHAAAAHLSSDPALVRRNQPAILNLHLEFLRPCVKELSTIVVTILKTGAAASTLQMHLYQSEVLKVVALATSTNFDISIGPSAPHELVSAACSKPKPDFEKIVAHKPDENWLASSNVSEVIAFTKRLYTLYPRGGNAVDGMCDFWNGFQRNVDERIDATHVALVALARQVILVLEAQRKFKDGKKARAVL